MNVCVPVRSVCVISIPMTLCAFDCVVLYADEALGNQPIFIRLYAETQKKNYRKKNMQFRGFYGIDKQRNLSVFSLYKMPHPSISL